MKNALKLYQKTITQTGRVLNWVSMVILGISAAFTLFDVLGRTLLNSPIMGGYELTELMLVLMVAFGFGNSELMKKHVRVDLIMANVSSGIRRKFDMVNNLISCAICVFLGFRAIIHAFHLQHVGTTSGLLGIPLLPFVFLLGIGFIVIAAVFLLEFFEDLLKGT